MKKFLAMIVPVLLVSLMCTVVAGDSSRTITIDKETAALFALGFGGYDNDGLFGPLYQQRWGRDYWSGYRDGWWRSQRYNPYRQYYHVPPGYYRHQYRYRPPARTGFRIRIGDGYLEWWESDYGSSFGFGTDGFRYRNYDRDWSRDWDW